MGRWAGRGTQASGGEPPLGSGSAGPRPHLHSASAGRHTVREKWINMIIDILCYYHDSLMCMQRQGPFFFHGMTPELNLTRSVTLRCMFLIMPNREMFMKVGAKKSWSKVGWVNDPGRHGMLFIDFIHTGHAESQTFMFNLSRMFNERKVNCT